MPLLLQIDPEDCEILLLALREKRLAKLDRLMELREEAHSLSAEIRQYDAKIARYSAAPTASSPPDSGESLPVQVPAPVVTNSGRVKRGESGKIITAKLSELNGAGATTWDLANSTGTKYSTVRRVLLELQEGQLAVERDGKWFFRHAIAQPDEPKDLWGSEQNEEGAAAAQATATPESETDVTSTG